MPTINKLYTFIVFIILTPICCDGWAGNTMNLVQCVGIENGDSLDSKKNIDYNKYFSERILRKTYSDNTSKDFLRSINAPYIEIGKLVPNGGGIRCFIGKIFNVKENAEFWDVFEESPYQEYPPMQYMRYVWCQLEDNDGNYLFDSVIEPVLRDCINKHQRFTIGLVINSFSIKTVYAGSTKDADGSIRNYSVPTYIFNTLQKSDYPMIKDDLYARWWSANIDSPYLYERFEIFIKTFDKWLEGYVRGIKIKRRDIIFGIEERYLGYWGEGGMTTKSLPKTALVNKYHDLLCNTFDDKIIIAPGQLLNHLPNKQQSYSNAEKVVMACVYNMLSKGTSKAATGLFRDSWRVYDNRYDIISKRVLMNEKGEVIPLAKYLVDNTYSKGYNTGEFGFMQNLDPLGLVPYQTIYHSFSHMKMSSISLHNYRIYEGSINKEYSNVFTPYGLHHIARDVLSVTGYRIVMNNSFIMKNSDGSFTVKILFSNIGTSKMYADYYRAHLVVKDRAKNIIKDYVSDFDFRTVVPSENLELGAYSPSNGVVLTYKLPALHADIKYAVLYLRIVDEKGIEYPMTLSNYGRDMERNGGDGSYIIGNLVK